MNLKLGAPRGVCNANNIHSWIPSSGPRAFRRRFYSPRSPSAAAIKPPALRRRLATASPQAPARPNWPKLPDDAACTKELTHYQTVLDADVGTGNVNRSVYDADRDRARSRRECVRGRKRRRSSGDDPVGKSEAWLSRVMRAAPRPRVRRRLPGVRPPQNSDREGARVFPRSRGKAGSRDTEIPASLRP